MTHEMESLNDSVYTDSPIDELEARLALEELEDREEMACIWRCGNLDCVGEF